MIFVTGCARSGTSLTMAVLRACGANLGPVNGLNESVALRNDVINPYLRRIGADPMGQGPLPGLDDIVPVADWRQRVLTALGPPPEPWATKNVKGIVFWPLWMQHFPEATWLIVRRDRDDIARSCLRTQWMKRYNKHAEWREWAAFYHRRADELAASTHAVEVWPHAAVKGDIEVYRPAIEALGLTWNADAVTEVIDPTRWHA